jgi:hypothetical protein
MKDLLDRGKIHCHLASDVRLPVTRFVDILDRLMGASTEGIGHAWY